MRGRVTEWPRHAVELPGSSANLPGQSVLLQPASASEPWLLAGDTREPPHNDQAMIGNLSGDMVQNVRQYLLPIEHLLTTPGVDIPLLVPGRCRHDSASPVRLIVCRRCCGFVQIRKADGRRQWVSERRFACALDRQTLLVQRPVISLWLASPEFRIPLALRLRKLGVRDCETLIANAACEPGWRGLAALDAALRQLARLFRRRERTCVGFSGRSLRSPPANRELLVQNWRQALVEPEHVPRRYWFVRSDHPATNSACLSIRGVLVVPMSAQTAGGWTNRATTPE